MAVPADWRSAFGHHFPQMAANFPAEWRICINYFQFFCQIGIKEMWEMKYIFRQIS